ncbi:hypothetical protein jhhlp_004363 [Lomentospora prolificans]|uniref:RRM domain-containing protein n=1 Tax=Lomentospora prolificans TaxID=41688 RepID=A0A2N3NBI8_9PEZI|nr:hypothetical protein jhhlp_004363 [Lomentospora prolificans]
MSGKLDKSLDELLTSRRGGGGRRRGPQRRASGGRNPAPAAPVGGIQKNNKATRASAAKPPAKGAALSGDSKIIVSNLPKDVTEQQIKEYFVQSVGSIKRVELSYGPNSQSRGIANVTFSKPDGASKAFQKLNGLLVDNRPIKIEIVVGAAQAASVIPQPKSLAERATQPKAQPKSAAADKNAVSKTGQGAGRTRGKRRGRSARPAKKTAEELDSEMADYFGAAENNNAAAGTGDSNQAVAPAATNGDAAMEDDILVS